MMYNGHGMGIAWTLMIVAVVLPVLLIAVALVVTQLRREPDQPSSAAVPPAERVLADRFARGEIDSDEYEHRLHTLRATRP
jgi:putative membrane protein